MPWDVALDAQDRVYVPDYGTNRIQVFDENGAFLYQWGTAGKGFGEFSHPAVIAFDQKQTLYMTDSDNHRVLFFNNGTFISGFGFEGTGPGQFAKPESIAIDSKGNVYVADTTNNNVQMFFPKR
jgi:DNA-binding beta-propeller fold protein YncE